jgi:hypothetical protein
MPQLVDFGTKFSAMDAAVWGNCSNFRSYSSLIQACGIIGGESVVTEAACATFGPSCAWDGSHCTTTAVAMLRNVFGAAADAPAVAAATACNAANATDTCAAVGVASTVDAGLLAAVASGNFTQVALLIQTLASTTGASSSAPQTGAAGMPTRSGGALVGGGLLLLAALALA